MNIADFERIMFTMSEVKLFISHSERDARFAAPLEEWLRAGLSLGKDDIRCTSVNPIQCGRAARDVLKEDLRSARAIIGLLSTNSLGSHWAQMEMGAGWVQDRFHPVRVPGIRHGDLPPPHNDLISPGYCEMLPMHELMEDIAEVLNVDVQPTADQKLEQITQSAEKMLMADAVRWFSLPVFLSAWRISPSTYRDALYALCCETQLNLSEAKLMDCVTDDGIICGDPEELPNWAQGHWAISREAVNFMLSPSSENPDLLEVPKNVLPGAMIAEMKNALGAGKDRSSLMQKWFENAERYLSENSPIARDSHGASGHR